MSEHSKRSHPMLHRIRLLGACLLLVPVLSACENRLLVATVTLDETLSYTVNSTGQPSVTQDSFDRGSLTSALDIPNDSRITNVEIERLALFGGALAGNEANFFSLLVETRDAGTSVWRTAYENSFPLPVAALQFIGSGTPLDDVVAAGITKLRENIENNLKGIDDIETEVRVTSRPVTVLGETVDADLNIQIDVIIKATVEYEACTEVPSFGIFDPGVPCDPDDFGSFQ